MSYPLVDSHCHLDFPDFEDELDEVVDRAARAGVGWMLGISTKVSRLNQVIRIAEGFDNVFCTAGVHPHEVGNEPPVTSQQLIAMARHSKVVGFGETGLDYHYENSPREAQEVSFRHHINAARESGLPVIVHTRDADADTLRILEGEYVKGAYRGLIHCFSSTDNFAERVLEMGFYISFSGIVTFNKADELRRTAELIPLDRMLVETDSPYLAPAPKRGKRNEPAFVVHTAARLAELRGLDEETFAMTTSENFFRLFSKAVAKQK